ncbi:MAG: bifunctional hydroxymethylpyrimidine kinase/phosphomethylpyrimidine kinase [Syntrophomonadaceae bacterium]|nr:bifunctional hydroxymethylpyrimidine kinase/phosphomethylpyrimidine kinase [Syntrophomonadaceae bacterium]
MGKENIMQHILSIAGSDSCAGAGIQADLKTISALGGYGLTVITAVTAQNTAGVRAFQEVELDIVQAQLEAIFADIRVDAVKIGMLASSKLIELIASFFSSLYKGRIFKEKYDYSRLPLVVDPVMVAKSGDRLLAEDAVESLKNRLFPLATVITPNLPEAEKLLRRSISDQAAMEMACRDLLQLGSQWVVVKGGHLAGEPVDIVGHKDFIYKQSGRRVAGGNNHGTGCTFSSALASYLAQGCELPEGVSKAKKYVENCLAGGFAIGQGVGIMDHFNELREIKRC